MSITTKICSGCDQEKPLGDFTFNKKNNCYSRQCKPCVSKNTKRWQTALFESTNPEVMLDATFYKMLQSSRSNAKSNKHTFTLHLNDLRKLYKAQNGKCFYTGVPMTLRSPNHLNRDPFLISLDRRDSTQGYTPENTVLCCWSVNALKGWHSESIFYDTLKTLYTTAQSSGKYLQD